MDARPECDSALLISRIFRNNPNKRGFSLVELLIVVAIVGVLGVISFVAIQRTKTRALNERMLDDLVAIANALEDFRRDHQGAFPEPASGTTNQNVLCFYSDATYADCDDVDVAFRQGMIDNDLLTKRYLREVPTDPRTGSRYVYGVSKDKKFYQVAGIWEGEGGAFEARTVENLAKGFELPSLVRAYDGPNFVVDREANLPYPSDRLLLTGTLENLDGGVFLDAAKTKQASNGTVVMENDTLYSKPGGSTDIYFSDGSVTHLDEGSELQLKSLKTEKNDKTGTVTKILLKLNLGKIWNKVARLASASEFRVETTGAIAGVRGTEFGVDAAGAVTLKRGKVWQKTHSDLGLADGATAEQVLDVANPPDGDLSFVPLDPDMTKYIAYYSSIPLTRNSRPHILTIKDGTVTVRNVNFFANRVSKAIELLRGLAEGSVKRTVQVSRLAVYKAQDLADGLDNPTDCVTPVDISGKQTEPYSLIIPIPLGTPCGSSPLAMRFEYDYTDPVKGPITTFSGTSQIPVPQAGQEMDEKAIYPNLVPLESGFTLVAPDRVPKGGTFKVSVAGCPSGTTYTLSSNSDSSICAMPIPASKICNSDLIVTAGTAIGTCGLTATATLANGKIVTDTKKVQVVAPTAQLTVVEPIFVPWVTDHWEASFHWSARNVEIPSVRLDVAASPGGGSACTLTSSTSPIVIPNNSSCPTIAPGDYTATFTLLGPIAETIPPIPFTIPSAANAVSADFSISPTPNSSGVIEATGTSVTLAFAAPNPDKVKYSYTWAGAVSAEATQESAEINLPESEMPSTPGGTITKTVTLTIRDNAKNIVATRTRAVAVRKVVTITGIAFSPASASLYMASLGPISLASYPVRVTTAIGNAPTFALACAYAVDATKGSVLPGSLTPTAFGTIPVTCEPNNLPTGYVLGSPAPTAQLSLNVTGCGDGALNGTDTQEVCDKIGGTDTFKPGVFCASGTPTCATCHKVCTASTPRIDSIAFCLNAYPNNIATSATLYLGATLDVKADYSLCAIPYDGTTPLARVQLDESDCAFAAETSSDIQLSGTNIQFGTGIYTPDAWGGQNLVCALSSAPIGYTMATPKKAVLHVAVQGCGDGMIQGSEGETCDDGNTLNGDGCESTCVLATVAGISCVTNPTTPFTSINPQTLCLPSVVMRGPDSTTAIFPATATMDIGSGDYLLSLSDGTTCTNWVVTPVGGPPATYSPSTFGAPWTMARSQYSIRCESPKRSHPRTIGIAPGTSTFLADYTDDSPTTKTNPDYSAGGTVCAATGATASGLGLLVPSEAGKFLSCLATGNFDPNKGKIEIVLNNAPYPSSEFNQTSCSTAGGSWNLVQAKCLIRPLRVPRKFYLFDAANLATDTVNRADMYLGLDKKIFFESIVSNATPVNALKASYLGGQASPQALPDTILNADTVKVLVGWGTPSLNIISSESRIEGFDATGNSVAVFSLVKFGPSKTTNITAPINFYIGSQVNGADFTQLNGTYNGQSCPCQVPTQSPGNIKSMKILSQ